MRKLLLVLLITAMGMVEGQSQTLIQTYTDRCTGETTVFSIPQNGQTIVTFYNRSRSVSAADIYNGTFQAWLEETYQWWAALSPCSTTQAATTQTQQQTQQTAQDAANAATNAAAATNVPDTTTAKVPETPTTNVPDTTSSPPTNTGTNETQTNTSQTTTDQTQQTQESNTTETGNTNAQTGDADTSSSDNGQTSDASQSNNDESTSTSEDTTGGETNTQEENTEQNSDDTTSESESESESEPVEEEQQQEEEQQEEEQQEEKPSEEESEEETEDEQSEEESEETDEEDESEENEKKTTKKKKKKKKRNLSPPIISANLLSQQDLFGNYNFAMNLGVSRSSLMGDKTYSLNAQIFQNLKQFSLAVGYSKVFLVEGKPKWVWSSNLNGSRIFANTMTALSQSIVHLGSKGSVTGLSLSGTSLWMGNILENKKFTYTDQVIGASITSFYTKPFNFDRLSVSPMLAASYGLVSNSITGRTIMPKNKDVMFIVGSNFNYALTKRFNVNFGSNVIKSTAKEFPYLVNFTIGSRFSF